MKKYVLIGMGGVLGAISRYLVKGANINNWYESFPINTLIINISGSFVFALIVTTAFEIWELNADLRLGVTAGFLGAYTTFSTLCKETIELIKEGLYFSAALYIVISTLMGLAAVYLGIAFSRRVASKLIKKKKAEIAESAVTAVEGEVE